MDAYRDAVVGSEIDRCVIVVGLGGGLVGLDRQTGEVRWKNNLPGGGSHEVFLAFRYGVLVVSAHGDGLFRVDYLTGQTLWSVTTTGSGRATILVEPDLILVGKGGQLDAFDHHGRRVWQQRLPGRGLGPLALALPGNVAQADDSGSGS